MVRNGSYYKIHLGHSPEVVTTMKKKGGEPFLMINLYLNKMMKLGNRPIKNGGQGLPEHSYLQGGPSTSYKATYNPYK